MLAHCPPTLAGLRDKAVLLIGFCGAFRRSDLVNLDVEGLAKADEGLVLLVRKRLPRPGAPAISLVDPLRMDLNPLHFGPKP